MSTAPAYTPPEDAREFVPVMRYSPLYRFTLNRLMPAIGFATLLASIALPFILMGALWPRFEPDERLAALGFGALLSVVCAAGPALVLWVLRRQRRDTFDRAVYVDEAGITEVSGKKVKRCRWPDTKLRGIGAGGRLAFGWVACPGTRIWLDGRLVESNPGAPPPRVRMGWTTSYVVYPDGRRRPVLFSDSEIYQLIRDRIGTP